LVERVDSNRAVSGQSR